MRHVGSVTRRHLSRVPCLLSNPVTVTMGPLTVTHFVERETDKSHMGFQRRYVLSQGPNALSQVIGGALEIWKWPDQGRLIPSDRCGGTQGGTMRWSGKGQRTEGIQPCATGLEESGGQPWGELGRRA